MSTGAMLCVALTGCRTSTTTARPIETRTTALAFFQAIANQEWDKAYEMLHADDRGQMTRAQFAERGKRYRHNLGFEPVGVRIQAFDEQGEHATVHLTLSGRGESHHVYKDAITLRKTPSGWAVVLPARFGVAKS
jgi:hypothetical protein